MWWDFSTRCWESREGQWANGVSKDDANKGRLLPIQPAQRLNGQERVPLMVCMGASSQDDVALALASIHTESGESLLALVEASPVLLVFLRHFWW